MDRHPRRPIPPPRVPLPRGQNIGHQLTIWVTIIAVVLAVIALIEAGIYFIR